MIFVQKSNEFTPPILFNYNKGVVIFKVWSIAKFVVFIIVIEKLILYWLSNVNGVEIKAWNELFSKFMTSAKTLALNYLKKKKFLSKFNII